MIQKMNLNNLQMKTIQYIKFSDLNYMRRPSKLSQINYQALTVDSATQGIKPIFSGQHENFEDWFADGAKVHFKMSFI